MLTDLASLFCFLDLCGAAKINSNERPAYCLAITQANVSLCTLYKNCLGHDGYGLAQLLECEIRQVGNQLQQNQRT